MMLAGRRRRCGGQARAVRVRERARRQGAPSAGGGPRGGQRRAGDARPVSASVRAAVPRAGRAKPAPPRGGGIPRSPCAAAVRGGGGTACASGAQDVRFPGTGFAPTRVTVRVRGVAPHRVGTAERRGRVPVRAECHGGGVAGRRLGLPARAAAAATTARSRTGRASRCGPTSRSPSTGWPRGRAGGRSVPERHQRLPLRRRAGAPVRRPPGPEVGRAARREPPPLRHRARPRPAGAYGWLAANAPRFGFVKRYAWEPWHFGYTRNPGSASVGFGARGGDGRRHPGGPVVRAGELRAADHPRGAALERVGAPAGRAALRGVELQPVRALAGRARWASRSSCPGRRGGRPARPVRPRGGDRRPGAPDARPARPLRLGAARPRGLQRRAGRGSRCGCVPPFPRRAPTWRRSWACSAGRLTLAAGGLEVRLVE